jgi:uncharacterized protein YbaR (Trm112 family)
MALDQRLLDILACPQDKGPLYYLGDDVGLYNPRLRRLYLITDGIPVMLIDEAKQVTDEEHAQLEQQIASESIRPTFTANAKDGPAPDGAASPAGGNSDGD